MSKFSPERCVQEITTPLSRWVRGVEATGAVANHLAAFRVACG